MAIPSAGSARGGGAEITRPAEPPLPDKELGLSWVEVSPEPIPDAFEALIGNFDADADMEVYILSMTGGPNWICESDGSRRSISTFTNNALGLSQVLDFNGDGVDDIAPGPASQETARDYREVRGVDGKPLGRIPWWTTAASDPLVAADFDGQPGIELAHLVKNQDIEFRTPQGKLVKSVNVGRPVQQLMPLAADLNADGRAEVLCGMQMGAPDDVLDMNGAHVPMEQPGRYVGRPQQLVDLNRDGRPELLCANCYYDFTTKRWHFCRLPHKELPDADASDQYDDIFAIRSVAGDFDGDGRAELAVISGDPTHGTTPVPKLFLLDPDGKARSHFALPQEVKYENRDTLQVIHAGGHDHLVVKVSKALRISQ